MHRRFAAGPGPDRATHHDYAHNARWNDDNGYSHLRSSLVGTAKSYPLYDGKLAIGQWQQVVLCDFDSRPRERQVVVTIVGSKAFEPQRHQGHKEEPSFFRLCVPCAFVVIRSSS